MRSKPPTQPSPIHRARRARCGSVPRHRVLSVFAFQGLDFGRCAGRTAKAEYAQAPKDLLTRSLHSQSFGRDMAQDERFVRYGVYYRLCLSIGTLCATALIEGPISTEMSSRKLG